MKKIFGSIVLGLVLCYSLKSFGQSEATMYFMNSLPQVTYLNPASVPRYNTSIGLPGSSVFALYANNGFSYNDFVYKEGGFATVDLDDLYASMANRNYVNIAAQADIFRLSFRINPKLYFTYHASAKMYSSAMLPKEIVGIFVNGTLAYIDGSASLAPSINAQVYVENAISSSLAVNNDLTVGLRVKMIKGGMNIHTESSSMSLSLDTDYAITVGVAGSAQTSGIQNLSDDSYDVGENWKDLLINNGFGIDIGGTYNLTEKITLGLSVVDLGSITWKNDGYEYRVDETEYTFRGFDLQRWIDEGDDYIDEEMDSLENVFSLDESTISTYKSALPTKFYLSGSYQLARNLQAGMLFFSEAFNKRFAGGLSLNLTKDFGRRLTTSVSYTISNRSYNNLGLGASLNLPPFQLYLVGDNLLRMPFSLLGNGNLNEYVNSTQYFNLRAGLNLVFGWYKDQEKQPYPLKSRR